MKKALLAFGMVLMSAASASAGGLTHRISSSVQLTVDGPTIQSTRMGHSMSISGNNVTTTDGSNAGVVGNSLSITNDGFTGAASVITASQATSGESFSFSSAYTQGDALVTTQSALSNSGRYDQPNLYGESTTYVGGSAGTLAGSIGTNGAVSITAGGPGSTGIGQFVSEITVFD